jgi:hypothetical protein
MPLLSEIALIFRSSMAVITQNGKFFDCATTAFRERYVHFFSVCCAWGDFPVQRLSLRPSISRATIPPFHYCNPLMAYRLYTQGDFQHLSMTLDGHLIIQGVSGGIVNILGGGRMDYSE